MKPKTYLAVMMSDDQSGYPLDIYPSERDNAYRDSREAGHKVIGEFATMADAIIAIKGWLAEHPPSVTA
jgi:hypothetical protein